MKKSLVILFSAISFCIICEVCQSAEEVNSPQTMSGRSGRGVLYGDWQVEADYNGRKMESILSFSRDEQGNQAGQWISFWGISELKDVKYEDGQLSFAQVRQNREGESVTSNFKGNIVDGKLAGTMSSDRGEYKLEGKRSPRISRAVGSWDMKIKMGDQEFTPKLIIKSDNENKLTAQWQGQEGEHEITDVNYEKGKLTFKKKSKVEDRQRECAFEGTVTGDAISGVFKSENGEATAEGKRIGALAIGTWNLEVTSDRGVRKQRLKINPDMSGLYGSIVIDKVNFEDNKVSFRIDQEFGERKVEMSFSGTVEDAKLTGELTTSRGVQKVTGTKVVRSARSGTR